MQIITYLKDIVEKKGGAFCVLIDPDQANSGELESFVKKSKDLDVDALLVGSSLALDDNFNGTVKRIKSLSEIPVILFPGGAAQISRHADAILFLSLISGRNPDYLFGDHVKAAPSIRSSSIEPISTGYMLIESGAVSTAEFISNTRAIPREKPEIALAHALAAEYMGMKMIYLEAGSGAPDTVPDGMISMLKKEISLPIIVGGGITDPDTARQKIDAGADIIVIGNHLENNWSDAEV
ncbi:MAG: geranylgeranylglyceryl/heptaprenylglyceryl phosphate synthase, partial [bacterium]|nr:geranylgeranylglyceryl/heptaprenylglyceryl phosphate synthase [bacterium]